MGKRQLARGNVQHGQIPMYIGTHATPNGMHLPNGPRHRDYGKVNTRSTIPFFSQNSVSIRT